MKRPRRQLAGIETPRAMKALERPWRRGLLEALGGAFIIVKLIMSSLHVSGLSSSWS